MRATRRTQFVVELAHVRVGEHLNQLCATRDVKSKQQSSREKPCDSQNAEYFGSNSAKYFSHSPDALRHDTILLQISCAPIAPISNQRTRPSGP